MVVEHEKRPNAVTHKTGERGLDTTANQMSEEQ